MTPLFSIITVTWNAAKVIAPTLESVKAQSCSDYEYLVVDGASTDPTLQLVSERDNGLYDAMNKAIRLAQGNYLIWMNAGDAFADADSLARLAEAAKSNPGVIYGQTQVVNAERQVVGMRHLTAPPRLSADDFKHGMLVCHQAFVARRDIAPAYNLAYRFSADFDWCIRVLQQSDHDADVGDKPIVSFLTDGLTDKHHKASLKERYHIMCHYYGTASTLLRHVGFAFRALLRKCK